VCVRKSTGNMDVKTLQLQELRNISNKLNDLKGIKENLVILVKMFEVKSMQGEEEIMT